MRTVDSTHELSASEIRGVVMGHLGALRACYEKGAARDPLLKGTLTVQWQIAPAGNVSDARSLNSKLGNAAVEECILREVRQLRFPASPALSNVEWPFTFGISAAVNDGGA
jgi:hypothetical protein